MDVREIQALWERLNSTAPEENIPFDFFLILTIFVSGLWYMTWKKREINRSCLISACHFYEQSRIIKWNYLVSIKPRSFFVACCRK